VSIEAFEHFGFERYDDFFKNCFDILPDDGRMTIQSSVGYHPYDLQARGKKLTFELARFAKFIGEVIFPGGRIPTTQMMVEHGEKAGFVVPSRCRCATTTSRPSASGRPASNSTRTRPSRRPVKRATTTTCGT
jgi:cyclopropane fatty-acyl-phospholipid synthase-like methyltransferase